MTNFDVNVQFRPERLKAYSRNDVQMEIAIDNRSDGLYWAECEIKLQSPLSLAHDSELNNARTRVGILKPFSGARKQIRLYTRPNNYPDEYSFSVIAYVYDSDGAIAERLEKKVSIDCAVEESAAPVQDKKSSS